MGVKYLFKNKGFQEKWKATSTGQVNYWQQIPDINQNTQYSFLRNFQIVNFNEYAFKSKCHSEPTTPPKPDEIIPVTDEEIASVEAAVKDETKKDNSLRYEVLLSPAVKKVIIN